ncbi:MAG: DUF72 domain-containing protein [Paraburkholderia sp.]|nr:MAG: DUF72 domain-containing protein [Paraburkholderia sp.]
MDDAIALAQRHDARVKRPWCEPKRRGRLRHAVEVRHASFCVSQFPDILRRHHGALVLSDSVAGWPYFEDDARRLKARLSGNIDPLPMPAPTQRQRPART